MKTEGNCAEIESTLEEIGGNCEKIGGDCKNGCQLRENREILEKHGAIVKKNINQMGGEKKALCENKK